MGDNIGSQLATNLKSVGKGLTAMEDEWAHAYQKLLGAVENKDVPDFFHHLSDFRGACQQHAWKLHFYLFWPKWIGVYFLARWWFGG